MKRIILITILLLSYLISVNAQNVPHGMKYQAVARDHTGNILSNQEINLRITLYSEEDRKIQYSEIHSNTTNALGLFSLTIGEGQIESGNFEAVPWSTENIWMELAIDEAGDNTFVTISNSKLLAVPYAFHAATANKLSEENNGTQRASSDEGAWLIGGNEFSGQEPPGTELHTLGTSNSHDLILITSDRPRMLISGMDGKVSMLGDAEIRNDLDITNDLSVGNNANLGGNLEVGNNAGVANNLDVTNNAVVGSLETEGNVSLNTQGGMTIIYEEALLKNTLEVGEATTLYSSMDVLNYSPTNLTGTLNVDGTTNLNSSLDVNNNSPSNLTGSLTVDGLTNLKNTTQSNSPTDGALHVAGGLGLERNLNVGGDVKFGKTLYVGGNPNSNIIFDGHVAHFENTENANGIQIKIGAGTPHHDNNFVTFLNSNGGTVGRIEGEYGPDDLADNSGYQEELRNFDIDRDLAITALTISTAEGVMAATDIVMATADLTIATGDVAIAAAETVMAVGDVAAAAASSTGCGGVGACVTAPIVSFITSSGVNLVITIANGVLTTINLGLSTANLASASANGVIATANIGLATADLVIVEQAKQRFINQYAMDQGVTFESGAGDYAEYLPKLNPKIDFLPGEVVGLKNGLISKNTLGADRIMVISFKPAVLGAMPAEGTEADYEKVAFLGQIPVRVIGQIEKGDYILPSGFHNGFAIGKHPDKMLLSDYKKIIGIAWEGSESHEIDMINVAVGLNVNDFSGVIQQQQEELSELKNQMTQTNTILADLVPGFREAADMNSNYVEIGPGKLINNENEAHTHSEEDDHDHGFLTQHDVEMVQPDETNIIYYVPERKEYEAWIKAARQVYIDNNIKIEDHPFWNRLDTDPDYLEEVIIELETRFERTIHYHAEINNSKNN